MRSIWHGKEVKLGRSEFSLVESSFLIGKLPIEVEVCSKHRRQMVWPCTVDSGTTYAATYHLT